ncbi:MAG: LysM peptidoglycan-binding domain-containing protein, partial [Bacteroidota bacterium]
DIKVAITTYYAKHVVASGESLSLIAKDYLGDLMKYKEIFAANSDLLDNPDVIHPGQELVIPFPEGRSADA